MSSSDSSSSRERAFMQWTLEHPDFVNNIEMLQAPPGLKPSKLPNFRSKRQGIHQRAIDEISRNISNLENKLNNLSGQLDDLSVKPIPQVGRLIYSNNSQNIDLRKVAYLERQLQALNNTYLTQQYLQITDKISQLKDISNFLSGTIIPQQYICRPKPEIFLVRDTDATIQTEKKIQSVESAIKFLKEKITSYSVPVWRDKFEIFFKEIVAQALHRMDKELSYISPFESEIELSRALFIKGSPYKNRIDDLIDKMDLYQSKNAFVNDIISECYDLVPEDIQNDNNTQSAALLILFRAAFNRLYERKPHLFYKDADPDIIKLDKIAKLPAKLFPLPHELLAAESYDISLRELFASDKCFLASAQFLETAQFDSTPVDALFAVHKALVGVHKGALINRLGGQAAQPDDVNQLLGFDDLFSLFFGAAMAAELPDLFRLAAFIDDYAPRASLSPSFEYALANLEALILHCRTVQEGRLTSA